MHSYHVICVEGVLGGFFLLGHVVQSFWIKAFVACFPAAVGVFNHFWDDDLL